MDLREWVRRRGGGGSTAGLLLCRTRLDALLQLGDAAFDCGFGELAKQRAVDDDRGRAFVMPP
jgi:hypothetical protein